MGRRVTIYSCTQGRDTTLVEDEVDGYGLCDSGGGGCWGWYCVTVGFWLKTKRIRAVRWSNL